MRLASFGLIATCLAITAGAALAAPLEAWLGAWAHVPTAYNTSLTPRPPGPDGAARPGRPGGYAPLAPYRNITVRQITRLGADAIRVRVKFSNEFGAGPLRIGAARIALAGAQGAIVAGSDHVLTFAGKKSVVIPPGAPFLSDPVTWKLPAFARLAVSVYYPEDTTPPAHTIFSLEAFAAAAPGDQTGAPSLPNAVAARSGAHVSQIEIVSTKAKQVVVAFGDSTTEGVGSTVGAFRAWPDRLGERLAANAAGRSWSVVNAGVGSNRLLHDTPSVNALARFDRDVLSVPGVAAVIVALGVNDIQYSHRNPAEAVGAEEMIGALKQLALRAHSRGVLFYAATIMPFKGSGDYTEAGEAVRQAVNGWIRSDGGLDGVVDFDAAVRNPADSAALRPDFDGGGHLHPNDAGYAAMGEAVDLKLLTAGPKRATR